MPDPVLRIPVDDDAFKRYMEAFQRYQEQLQAQPEMWEESNEAIRDGVAANLALADAIGASVAAAVRLGDQQERNARQRKQQAQQEDAEQKRASSWRRAAIDHVQELSRTTATVLRTMGNFASGNGGAGGLFGMVSAFGHQVGGTLGGLINVVGEGLNANYLANNAVSDKGQFARGINATLGQQEGFQLGLGRYTNTDQGIDAVMNARGTAQQWAPFAMLGIRDFRDPSKNAADVYAEVLQKQVALAKRFTKGNITNWNMVGAMGGLSFGTTAEDLNRLMRAPDLNKAIRDAANFKTPIQDKQIDAATKSAVATDKLVQTLTDKTQVALMGLNGATDKLTDAVTKLTTSLDNLTDLFTFKWLNPTNGGGPASQQQWAKDHPWLNWFGIHPSGGPAAPTPTPSQQQWAKDHPWASFFGVHPTASGPMSTPSGPQAASMAPTTGHTTDQQAAVAALSGLGIRVTSWSRSHSEQAALYAKWQAYLHGGPWAARAAAPGHSDHEIGEALDIAYGRGITKAAIAAALDRAHVRHGQILDEGDHIHVSLMDRGSSHSRAAGGGTHAGHVQVHVKVSAPPGHQAAVSANGAARGG